MSSPRAKALTANAKETSDNAMTNSTIIKTKVEILAAVDDDCVLILFFLLLPNSDCVADSDDYDFVAFLRSFKYDAFHSLDDFIN